MIHSVKSVLAEMKKTADPGRLDGMARYGINIERRLGLKMPEIRAMAKKIGRDHDLALGLWASEIHEARILAPMLAQPAKVDGALMDHWVAGFDSWDICDQCCMNLFRRLPLAWDKVAAWAPREEEFVRRAAFALIATLSVHEKAEPDARFIALLSLIEAHSDDNRNFVRKAVNWALRQIGKRNQALNGEAIRAAERILARDTRAARWIAKDALRELRDRKTRMRLKA
ncbi:MAG: DNA alkylation repair protein [Rhodospirillaceae bacterium]|jgi:3-methyladenine DNA glycosylase AlkD|nr:DNA alkylation repair protein [Rhodospirillaceae bacterium]MBT5190971.1 DNA alkylation repair protein [Rhodospirillaceae bacterium]MBT5899335.1 DNA alkylation repair protein [Rhodospirillaceae bacterium]MBT6429215.1 DNA alkylation repair protein [Rhodospirillaceae bacterium]MBT7757572.1 DNA alkylation repair protein [Rhodospirillaceae bacterium]